MNNTTFAIVAIISALAMLGVAIVTVATFIQLQEDEAQRCLLNTSAPDASKGRCFQG
ncbi:MAG TPA: hypothetical protein VE573_14690 [Nitrososphaeraceae archaeon]|nr:hypothetical protein [Nitrososphaeraceae archaeon]